MRETPLNSMAIIWIAFAGIVTDGLFVWPLHIVMAAGQNADITLMLTGLWGIAVALLNPARENQPALWQMIFRGLNILGVLGVVILDAVMVSELSGMLQTFYYFETPRWVLSTPLLVASASAAMRRGNVPWRVVALWVPILAAGAVIILGISFTTVHHLRPLEPNQVVQVIPVIRAAGVEAFIGLSVGVTLRMASSFAAEPPSWAWRLVSIEIPILFFILLYVVAMGSLGPEALIQVRWPLVFVLDHVTLDSTFFLSRIGIMVILTWTIGMGMGFIVHLRITQWVVSYRWPRTARWTPIPVTGWWWVGSLLITSPHAATQIVLHWIDPVVPLYLGMELLILAASRLFMKQPAPKQRGTSSITEPAGAGSVTQRSTSRSPTPTGSGSGS